MSNFVYIDDRILWYMAIIFFVLLMTAIFMGCSNFKLEREKRQLKQTNLYLVDRINFFKDKLYRKNFKVPEIEEKK